MKSLKRFEEWFNLNFGCFSVNGSKLNDKTLLTLIIYVIILHTPYPIGTIRREVKLTSFFM